MPDFQIYSLSEKPEHVETCAIWSYAEWGVHYKDTTLDKSIERSNKKANSHTELPLAWIGIEGEHIAGMITLAENDHDDHKDLTPWLASMYVHPSFRRKGYATALIQHLHREAKKLGYNHLYLFTPDMMNLYQKSGWEITGKVRDPRGIHDHEKLMEIAL